MIISFGIFSDEYPHDTIPDEHDLVGGEIGESVLNNAASTKKPPANSKVVDAEKCCFDSVT